MSAMGRVPSVGRSLDAYLPAQIRNSPALLAIAQTPRSMAAAMAGPALDDDDDFALDGGSGPASASAAASSSAAAALPWSAAVPGTVLERSSSPALGVGVGVGAAALDPLAAMVVDVDGGGGGPGTPGRKRGKMVPSVSFTLGGGGGGDCGSIAMLDGGAGEPRRSLGGLAVETGVGSLFSSGSGAGGGGGVQPPGSPGSRAFAAVLHSPQGK
jgi:hypothetical protein